MKFTFNKLVVISGVVALTAMSSFAGLSFEHWRVTAQSDDYGWALLRLPTNRPIRLVKKLSHADCKYGKSWGITDRGLWVDRGCRAIFELAGPKPNAWRDAWERRRQDGDRDHSWHEWNDRDWQNWHN
jgi:hypothetical protein